MNRSVIGTPYNIKVTVCHTAGHYGEEYNDWNSDVFSSRQNCSSNGAGQTDGRRAFHAQAPATGKA